MSFGNQPSASPSESKRQKRPQEQQSAADSVCRVCMGWPSDSGPMVDLFVGQVQGMILAEVLALIGAVKPATEDDRLPKECCDGCLNALESAYNLRMLCQDSDRKLRDVFLSDGKTAVVKKEIDEDNKFNALDEMESRCKSELAEMLTFREAIVSESIHAPKLEIIDYISGEESHEMEDDGDGRDDTAEDNMDADSSTYESVEDQNVFDVVKAVVFKCCGCKLIFNTSEDLKVHSNEVHDDTNLPEQVFRGSRYRKQCDICYKMFCNGHALRKHKRKDKLNFRCKVCGDVFWTRKRVYLHYEGVHGPNPVIKGPSKVCCAGACQEQFETEEQLREHSVSVHLPEKPAPDPSRPFSCNVCYRCFKSDALLYTHQSRMLRPRIRSKNHVCVQCGMAFPCPSALRHHEVTHTGEKVFQCPKCPKAYSNRETYRKHLLSETFHDEESSQIAHMVSDHPEELRNNPLPPIELFVNRDCTDINQKKLFYDH
ncbi:hypothetical protein RP20_CCG013487 [Aedes albopictus]|nr:hypothetical protein RP20_CCG013487 [Aedes albopictus]